MELFKRLSRDKFLSRDELDNDAYTPLQLAVHLRRYEMIKPLIQMGADVNAEKSPMEPPLLHATAWSTAKMVELLIQMGADVNLTRDSSDPPLKVGMNRQHSWRPPLHVAINRLYSEKASLLLAAGAEYKEGEDDYLYRDFARESSYCKQPQRTNCITTMLDILDKVGADVHKLDKHGRTALEVAVRQGSWDGAEALLRVEANRELLGTDKLESLRSGHGGGRITAADLLESGIDVNARTPSGFGLLHAAVLACDAMLVDSLLEAGANAGVPMSSDLYPMDVAAARSDCPSRDRIMDSLYENVVGKDPRDAAALYAAVWNGYSDAVNMLVSAGGDLEELREYVYSHYLRMRWTLRGKNWWKDEDRGTTVWRASSFNYTLLERSVRMQNIGVVRALLSAGAEATPRSLDLAVIYGDIPIIRELLGEPPDSTLLQAALVRAAYEGRLLVVRELIGMGADPNGSSAAEWAPLQRAVRNWIVESPTVSESEYSLKDLVPLPSLTERDHSRVQMVRELLDAGADPNVGSEGRYPLGLVGSRHHPSGWKGWSSDDQLVSMLLDAGADAGADFKTLEGRSYDILYGASLSMTRLLLDAGANPCRVTYSRRSTNEPWRLTTELERVEIVIERKEPSIFFGRRSPPFPR